MKIVVRKRMLGAIPLLEVVPYEMRNEKLPLIIYYHGWQSSKELNLTQARSLAREGFRILLPDSMNHGERKQPVSKIPSFTFWQSIQSNLFEFGFILDHFRKKGVVSDVIGVGGLSMGGMTTCGLLTHHPEIKAAACVMGSPKLVAYRDRIQANVKAGDRYLPKDYETLTNWIPEYDLSLQTEKIADRPFFIWHGRQDVVVPYEDTAAFVAENPDLKSIQFVSEKEEHLVKSPTMEKVTDFFVKALLN
ncbi:hypothetical protein BW727_100164 [Jeotgalibaca dankookensis]|uniref:AB hydrolase-1 domain-containing protein n=1 Tax=Jeotgalibaca dankookensis TaxID=708126 RepID=A0A1S6ILY8_9LACT|nr:alpha/beta fold hydrolase [Jeotgalibaca dankookensis]AQS52574.1 hypothetical protein BW727_100164 [Jeotgalibaca dankookensis]